MTRITGRYERTAAAGEEVAAFVPLPLPPRDPALDIEGPLAEPLRSAEHALAAASTSREKWCPPSTGSSTPWSARRR